MKKGAKLTRDKGPATVESTSAYYLAYWGAIVSREAANTGSDEPTGRLALVFELMEMNLYEAIKGRTNYLPEQRVKFYIYQLLKAIEHMHRNGIFHRDIKP